MTKSMQIVIDSLHLDKLYIIYSGKDNYKLDNIIEVVNIDTIRKISL